MKITTPEEVVKLVKSGDRVFFQGAAMTPNELIDALCERDQELENIELVSIHTEGDAKYTQEPFNKTFHLNSCFVGGLKGGFIFFVDDLLYLIGCSGGRVRTSDFGTFRLYDVDTLLVTILFSFKNSVNATSIIASTSSSCLLNNKGCSAIPINGCTKKLLGGI